MSEKKSLSEIARLFFKLGIIGFGGPAAHIAMMEDEVVEKRKWMSPEHFLDLIGATNLIPGPNSTEMTMHCGQERAGWQGLIVAGFCFILPAVLITAVFAYLYKEYGQLPAVSPWIYGIKAAVIAIILNAVYKLGKKALKSWQLGVLGALALVAALFGISEVLALLATGLLGILVFGLIGEVKNSQLKSFLPFPLFQAAGLSLGSLSSLKIFFIFLKVGAVLYGSGYVLFAFLDGELVGRGLLDQQELIDAIAVGQMTPGPVLTTATFIGWQLGGWQGAVAATLGIFLPSFFFVWALNPLIPKMRKSKIMSAFLDGVNIGAVAVILAVTFTMAKSTLVDWQSIVIFGISLAMIFGPKKINSAFIVLMGSVLGYALSLAG